MQLGLVTYNLACNWSLDTIVDMCQKTGFEGVEFRTTHPHGVEDTLSKTQRADVKARMDDSGIVMVGLGSAFDFHSDDPDVLKTNIEGTLVYVQLAHDLGIPGVKVRPNGLQSELGISAEKTVAQIADALNICAVFAHDLGVDIRLEVHGKNTSSPETYTAIIERADHPNVKVCWNSNMTDLTQGTIEPFFKAVGHRIGLVHITDLSNHDYPWRDLFRLLRESGYEGFTLAEIPESSEPERFMKYYRALWLEYQRQD